MRNNFFLFLKLHFAEWENQGRSQRSKKVGGEDVNLRHYKFILMQREILEKGHKIYNFLARAKFFTYFWGSTKFLIEWWGFQG